MTTEPLKTPHSLLNLLVQHGPQWNSAWSEFFGLYGGWIRSIALRRKLRDHEANDVLQETMTELFRVLPRGRYRRQEGKFRGFLAGVVRHNISRALERRYREERRTESLHFAPGENDLAHEARLADERPGPDEEFDHCVKLALVEQAMRALVSHRWVTQQRVDIFLALTGHQKSPVEVAAEFGTNRNNVDAAKHAVKKKLIEMIRCLEEGIDPREDPDAP